MMNPAPLSGWWRRLRIMPIMMSSGTYCPLARIGWASRPSGVPVWISARSMSPVAMCGMPKRSRSMFAWVPLPLPGAPYSSKFIELFDEAAVLAHDQLRLQLFHRVQGNADDDQDCGTPQIHLLMRNAGNLGRGYRQDDGDKAQECGAGERDSIHDRGQVVGSGTSRTDARDEARVAFEVVGDVVDLERDGGVEIREPEREREIQRVVRDRHR